MGSLKEKTLEYNDGTLLDLYDIFRCVNTGFRRSVGRCVGRSIVSGLGGDIGYEVESGKYGEIGVDVGGGFCSRDSSNINKYVKYGVNVIIDDSVVLGVNIGVDDEVCISVCVWVYPVSGMCNMTELWGGGIATSFRDYYSLRHCCLLLFT